VYDPAIDQVHGLGARGESGAAWFGSRRSDLSAPNKERDAALAPSRQAQAGHTSRRVHQLYVPCETAFLESDAGTPLSRPPRPILLNRCGNSVYRPRGACRVSKIAGLALWRDLCSKRLRNDLPVPYNECISRGFINVVCCLGAPENICVVTVHTLLLHRE
jgi:hypothetical protein